MSAARAGNLSRTLTALAILLGLSAAVVSETSYGLACTLALGVWVVVAWWLRLQAVTHG